MSLDYPNRNDWLAVRATNKAKYRRAFRYTKSNESGQSRKDEKAIARRAQATKRAYAVRVHAENGFKGRAPKVKSSPLMIDMLANRRLRQRLAA